MIGRCNSPFKKTKNKKHCTFQTSCNSASQLSKDFIELLLQLPPPPPRMLHVCIFVIFSIWCYKLKLAAHRFRTASVWS